MTTVRQVLNRVAIATGGSAIDPTVSTITDADTLLKLEFLNEFKEEIESAAQWRALRQTLTATVLAGTTSISLTGSNERSRLVRVPNQQSGEFVPLVFDITDPASPYALSEMGTSELFFRTMQGGTGNSVQQPGYFTLGSTSAQDVTLHVWPAPTTDRSLSAHLVVPQPTFEATDLDTVIKIPTNSLIRGLIWYVREERGEEIGPNSVFTEERYDEMLAEEVSREVAESGDSLDIVVV